jgi:uncharacterized protein (TIGR03437 family)
VTLCGFLPALFAAFASAQIPADWHPVGTPVYEAGLAGPASGAVNRIWYAANRAVRIQTASGHIFETADPATADLSTWKRLDAPGTPILPPIIAPVLVDVLPEPGAQVRSKPGDAPHLYAFGTFVYRSDDGGKHWENLTVLGGRSILGGPIRDLTAGALGTDDVLVAGDSGVFRSADGGRSWTSLNPGLSNLPVNRFLDLPSGTRPLRLATSDTQALEWLPGQKLAWTPADAADLIREAGQKATLTESFGITVTALATAGDLLYAGLQTGEIRVSMDGGNTWRGFVPPGLSAGPVERFWINPADPRIALAALGQAPAAFIPNLSTPHVLHTVNGGVFWDDFTANLPHVAAHGITADLESGAIYAATDEGLFLAYSNLRTLGAGPSGSVQSWSLVRGLGSPESLARVLDVKLDAQGNQLWAALEGDGVFVTLAPHRLRSPVVVSAADLLARSAAPGSLISILGARVDAARAGNLDAPVLASTNTESQVQIPFEIRPDGSVALSVTTGGASLNLAPLKVAPASPAIFVDRDSSPLLLDTETGVLLSAANPARSGSRIQILATGLGKVTPDWPTGTPAPLDNTPKVAGAVHAYLDRSALSVTRAELAPGYVGLYLVEVEIPRLVNYGPAELFIDVDGAASNRVRVYIEP